MTDSDIVAVLEHGAVRCTQTALRYRRDGRAELLGKADREEAVAKALRDLADAIPDARKALHLIAGRLPATKSTARLIDRVAVGLAALHGEGET
jgi:hypothetical protein